MAISFFLILSPKAPISNPAIRFIASCPDIADRLSSTAPDAPVRLICPKACEANDNLLIMTKS